VAGHGGEIVVDEEVLLSSRSLRNFEHGLPMQTPLDPPIARTSVETNDDLSFSVVLELGCDGLFKQLVWSSSCPLSLVLSS
jgi:hypothetical protein